MTRTREYVQTAICMAVAALVYAGLSGCSTVQVANVATPSRIESVTALGAYYSGQAMVRAGNRAELERALAGLKACDTVQVDLVTVAAALHAAGVTVLNSTEGQVVLGVVLTFADLWTGTVQPIVDSERAQAILHGCITGFTLALRERTGVELSTVRVAPVSFEAELVKAVKETRPQL